MRRRTTPKSWAGSRCLVVATVVALIGGCGSTDDTGEEAGSKPKATKSGDGSSTTGGGSSSTSSAPASSTTAAPEAPAELPRGGTRIFPDFRVVAYYGNAEASALGVLGDTPPSEAAARVEKAATPYGQPDRPVLPAFELIVSVVQSSPGADGNYSVPTSHDKVMEWLQAARAARMLLILDIQPGRSEFLPEVQRFEEFLRLPDVGLALDSEWRMPPGEIPGRTVGTVDASEVNEVSAWLADIVAEEKLPEKLFVLHQFTEGMISNRDAVVDRPGLASVFHVDGFGGRRIKLEKYAVLRGTPPFASGLKLFYEEDTNMFGPAEVLALENAPDLITYQ